MIIKLKFKEINSSNQTPVRSLCTLFVGARALIDTYRHCKLLFVTSVESTTSELDYQISLMSNF